MVVWARSLFDGGDRIEVAGDGAAAPARVPLGQGAWLAVRRRVVLRHDLLLEALAATVPWRHERRPMYDREVDVPRLVASYPADGPLPHPAVDTLRHRVDGWFADVAGPVGSVGLAWYRDGRDSVAWHGDRIGRHLDRATLVAVVAVGARRRFLLRPAAGGPTRRVDLGEGDLLVMGGSCQRTWRHAVPKTRSPVGPRISLQFRAPGSG